MCITTFTCTRWVMNQNKLRLHELCLVFLFDFGNLFRHCISLRQSPLNGTWYDYGFGIRIHWNSSHVWIGNSIRQFFFYTVGGPNAYLALFVEYLEITHERDQRVITDDNGKQRFYWFYYERTHIYCCSIFIDKSFVINFKRKFLGLF